MAIDLLATLRLKDDFTKPMKKAEKGLGSLSKTATKVTGVVAGLGLGAAMTGFAKSVVTEGMEIDSVFSELSAVTRTYGDDLDGLKDSAVEMAKTSVFGIGDTAQAMKYLGMSGMDTNEILAATPAMLDLAAAGTLDLAEAADIASNILSAFSMDASEMGRVADVLAEAAAGANTDVRQLGDAMSYTAPVAAAYGWSIEEATAATQIFSDVGIQGSRAGMTLKNTISQLAQPTGQTAKKLKELGLSAADVNPEVHSMADILKNLTDAGAKATDAIALVGSEAGPGFAAMIAEGNASLSDRIALLNDAEGAAAKMAQDQNDNLLGDIRMFQSMMEAFKYNLYKQLGASDAFRPMIQSLTGFVEKLDAGIPKLVEFLQKNDHIIKGLAIAAGVLASAAAGFVALSLAVTAVTALTSPIGLIVTGISLLGVAFMTAYKKVEPFRNAVDGVIAKVKSLYAIFQEGGLGAVIKKILPDGVFESVAQKVSEFVSYLGAKWAELQPSIQILVDAFMTGKDLLIDVFTSLLAYLQPVFAGLVSALQIVGDIAVMVFRNIIAPAIGFLMDMFSAAWTLIGPILELLGTLFGATFEVLKVVWQTIMKPVAEYLTGAFANSFEAAKPYVDSIRTAFEWLGDKVSWASDMLKDLAGRLKNIKIPDWVSNLGGKIAGAANYVGNLVSGGGEKGNSHYHGLDYVKYDGYTARLHKGERILTAQENREYSGKSRGSKGSRGDGITININGMTVREEGDINKIAYELAKMIEREGGWMA